MTPERENISSKNIQQLLSELRTGALNPVEVLEAYQAKALHVDKEINAVCDFILSAADWAQYLLTVPQTERGPLYGLPISVKVSHWSSLLVLIKTPTTRNVSTWRDTTVPSAWLSSSGSQRRETAAL